MGSTEDARRAGMKPAGSAATNSVITAADIASGSFARMPKRNEAIRFEALQAAGIEQLDGVRDIG